jgi:hypothetical protein
MRPLQSFFHFAALGVRLCDARQVAIGASD